MQQCIQRDCTIYMHLIVCGESKMSNIGVRKGRIILANTQVALSKKCCSKGCSGQVALKLQTFIYLFWNNHFVKLQWFQRLSLRPIRKSIREKKFRRSPSLPLSQTLIFSVIIKRAHVLFNMPSPKSCDSSYKFSSYILWKLKGSQGWVFSNKRRLMTRDDVDFHNNKFLLFLGVFPIQN